MREFWALTPAETIGVLKAAAWREEQAHKRAAWLAWHMAAFQRTKRLPALASLLGGKPKKLTKAELGKRREEHEGMVERYNESANERKSERAKGKRISESGDRPRGRGLDA